MEASAELAGGASGPTLRWRPGDLPRHELVGPVAVLDGLFLGDAHTALDKEFIVANKVTHIVNCVSSQVGCAHRDLGIAYLAYDWADSDGTLILDEGDVVIADVTAFVNRAWQASEGVLIHSVRGQSRSCCILLALLMKQYAWNLHKALQLLDAVQPDHSIRPPYLDQLAAFECRLQSTSQQPLQAQWSITDAACCMERDPFSQGARAGSRAGAPDPTSMHDHHFPNSGGERADWADAGAAGPGQPERQPARSPLRRSRDQAPDPGRAAAAKGAAVVAVRLAFEGDAAAGGAHASTARWYHRWVHQEIRHLRRGGGEGPPAAAGEPPAVAEGGGLPRGGSAPARPRWRPAPAVRPEDPQASPKAPLSEAEAAGGGAGRLPGAARVGAEAAGAAAAAAAAKPPAGSEAHAPEAEASCAAAREPELRDGGPAGPPGEERVRGAGIAVLAHDVVTPMRAAARRQAQTRHAREPAAVQSVGRSGREASGGRRRSIGSVGPRLSRRGPHMASARSVEAAQSGSGGRCASAVWSGDLNLAVTSVASRRSIGSMGPPLSRQTSPARGGALAEAPRVGASPPVAGLDAGKTAAAATALAAAASAAAAAARAAAAAANLLAGAELEGGPSGGEDERPAEAGRPPGAGPAAAAAGGGAGGLRGRAAPAALDAIRGGGPVRARFDLFS